MVYVTMKMPPMYKQMTVEELLFGNHGTTAMLNDNSGNTRTDVYEVLSPRIRAMVNVNRLITRLEEFNVKNTRLYAADKKTLYNTFFIPKASGRGFRRIDAPNPELMEALRDLKNIFENDFHALYHTSAFAYIRKRCTIDAVKRHQANESKWFEKEDLSNFFGSTTMEFVMKMLGMVFPFSEVISTERGERAMRRALDLAFLNGGLPQGTPISPTITNIMMIPIDHRLANELRDFNGQRYVYTRYADDFLISSKYTFNPHEIRAFINGVLREFDAPFMLKAEKSRYGSSAGSNWNLGVLLNKDNQITIGSKRKRQFEAMLNNYLMDRKNGNPWALEDIQVLEGLRNYYRMVEGETIDKIVTHIGEKHKIDIVRALKDDLKV